MELRFFRKGFSSCDVGQQTRSTWHLTLHADAKSALSVRVVPVPKEAHMKNITRAAVGVVSLGLLLILLAGCESAKISDITRDPVHFSGKEVTIAGRATNSFGAMNEGASEI